MAVLKQSCSVSELTIHFFLSYLTMKNNECLSLTLQYFLCLQSTVALKDRAIQYMNTSEKNGKTEGKMCILEH